jgi:capsular polysaccharide biosynthesis protein
VSQRTSPQRDVFLVSWKTASRSIEAPCLLVGSDDNYSHWVLRSLLKLWLVDGEPALRELPWVVASQLTAFQREYLDLLAVPESRLLRVPQGEVLHFRRLYVPTQMLGNRGFLDGVRWLRGKLSAFLCPPSEASERIYVSRADQPRRRLVNEDEVFEALAPLGFRRVALTGMAVQDQAALFSRAHCVAGPHGAGLTNLVYSQAGARVVEIGSTNILKQNHFRWMAPLLGQRIVTVESNEYVMEESRRHEVQPVNWDYRVPVGRVREAVLSLLA